MFKKIAVLSLLTSNLILAGSPALAHDVASSLKADIAADYEKNLKSLFVHFHKNPELSFRETKTADRLAAEIKALGYEVTTGIGQTGVVAVLKNGEGPTVMLRADMDGLPVKEDTGLSYASRAKQVGIDNKENFVMHACGHDVHITSLIGTARQWPRAQMNGLVRFCLSASPQKK